MRQPGTDPQELVPIYTLNDPATAELLKNRLEQEGIDCQIEGARQAALTGVLQIRLHVVARDADRAREILEETEG